MSNRYFDRFIYAIDDKNVGYEMEDYYYASLGCAYRDVIQVGDKTYVVFTEVGDCDTEPEIQGPYLPLLDVDDCCSFFSDQPSSNILQIVKESGLDKTDIVKMVCLDFQRVSCGIYEAEGWIITKDGKRRVDSEIMEKAISSNNDVELVADYVIRQLTEDDFNDNKGE